MIKLLFLSKRDRRGEGQRGRGAEGQRGWGAEEERERGSEGERGRGAKRQRDRAAEGQRGRGAERQRGSGGTRKEGYPGTNYSDVLDTRGLVKLRSFNDCEEFHGKEIESGHRRVIVVFFSSFYHFVFLWKKVGEVGGWVLLFSCERSYLFEWSTGITSTTRADMWMEINMKWNGTQHTLSMHHVHCKFGYVSRQFGRE